MSTDPNGWLMSGGVGSAKFDAHGDCVNGTITETPELRQQTDFDTGAPLFWDDGKPKMQLVVTLATIAIGVPDAAATCDAVRVKAAELGGGVTREAGPVKGGNTIIAFITDPDGYKIELIERKEG